MGKITKGIVLAGGAGTRLYPMSVVASKQLQPIYNKPMVYYPLSTLILAGISDILLISTPDDTPRFESLLGDGKRLGISISYKVQPKPQGIAQAFLVGEDFIADEPVCLILGDNVFYGQLDFLRKAFSDFDIGATIFGYPVHDPERYGVVEYAPDGTVVSIEEKPAKPKSNFAVPGLYIYDRRVVEFTRALSPSARGELEITDLNGMYLKNGELRVHTLGRGVAWLDTGTPESLLDASNFVHAIEARQGLMIGCIEETAIRAGFIEDNEAFSRMVTDMPDNEYRRYVEAVWKSVRKQTDK